MHTSTHTHIVAISALLTLLGVFSVSAFQHQDWRHLQWSVLAPLEQQQVQSDASHRYLSQR